MSDRVILIPTAFNAFLKALASRVTGSTELKITRIDASLFFVATAWIRNQHRNQTVGDEFKGEVPDVPKTRPCANGWLTGKPVFMLAQGFNVVNSHIDEMMAAGIFRSLKLSMRGAYAMIIETKLGGRSGNPKTIRY